MTKKEIALLAVDALKKEFPDAICSLTYKDPLQLLVATRLAAQCTDARVNMVTPALFEKYKCAEDFANANVEDVEELIKSCGLYKTKAKSLVAMGKALTEQYNGVVPDTLEELIKLPGIGRKTANLVMGDIFGKPAVVVDTHCIRITRRLGLHNEKDPKKIVFTEGEDSRILEAASRLLASNFLHPILVGDPEKINASAENIRTISPMMWEFVI